MLAFTVSWFIFGEVLPNTIDARLPGVSLFGAA